MKDTTIHLIINGLPCVDVMVMVFFDLLEMSYDMLSYFFSNLAKECLIYKFIDTLGESIKKFVNKMRIKNATSKTIDDFYGICYLLYIK